MTVYIEVVILNNLLIDLWLMVTTCMARRRQIHKCRLLFSAVVGVGAATAYAVLPAVAQIVIRILLAPVLALIFDKYEGPKDFAASLAIFVLLTFALGGVVEGAEQLIGVEITGYAILGLIVFGVTALQLTVSYALRKRANAVRRIETVSVGFKGKTVACRALFDSGNALTDNVTGAPVIILSKHAEMQLSGLDAVNCSDYDGMIEVNTVGGTATMPLVKLDGVSVGADVVRAYAALSGRDFDGFEIILQNTMWGNYVKDKKDHKKHSAILGLRRTFLG